MDDKTNLYVFEKKEVALIFIFMILIAVTSFVLGVKVGKSFTYSEVDRALEEVNQVEILSEEEEKANRLMNEDTPASEYEEDVHSRIEEHIRREFEQETTEPREPQEDQSSQPTDDILQGEPLKKNSESQDSLSIDQLRGKYTIQLSSHRSKNEAEQFAQGFEVRGYEPIINEVEVPGKGIWYRVSIGIFDTITEAKDYVLKERTLFQDEDYVFQRL